MKLAHNFSPVTLLFIFKISPTCYLKRTKISGIWDGSQSNSICSSEVSETPSLLQAFSDEKMYKISIACFTNRNAVCINNNEQ